MFARYKKFILPGLGFAVAFVISLTACQKTPESATKANTVPSVSPPSTITPSERAYVREILKDLTQDAFATLGIPAITEAEYGEACTLLRRSDWDLMEVYWNPDTTGRLGAVAGSLNGGMEGLNEVAEEKGIAAYTLADFCANVP